MTEPARLKGDDFDVADKKTKEGGLWETIKVIVQALLIALVIRTLLFQPFNIPSGSLIPTLLIGDYLFVSKYSYGYSHFSLPSFLDLDPSAMPGRIFASLPKRGDVEFAAFHVRRLRHIRINPFHSRPTSDERDPLRNKPYTRASAASQGSNAPRRTLPSRAFTEKKRRPKGRLPERIAGDP